MKKAKTNWKSLRVPENVHDLWIRLAKQEKVKIHKYLEMVALGLADKRLKDV